MSLEQAKAAILALMPRGIAGKCRRLTSGNLSPEEEGYVAQAVEWIEANGARLGFRIPNCYERARAAGSAHYLVTLGLTELGLFNAVGNHFDHEALRSRLVGPLDNLARRPVHRRTFHPPSALAAIYARLAGTVRSMGLPAEDSPFPADLRGMLTAAHGAGSCNPSSSDAPAPLSGSRCAFDANGGLPRAPHMGSAAPGAPAAPGGGGAQDMARTVVIAAPVNAAAEDGRAIV